MKRPARATGSMERCKGTTPSDLLDIGLPIAADATLVALFANLPHAFIVRALAHLSALAWSATISDDVGDFPRLQIQLLSSLASAPTAVRAASLLEADDTRVLVHAEQAAVAVALALVHARGPIGA